MDENKEPKDEPENKETQEKNSKEQAPAGDPVLNTARKVLLAAAVLFLWYVFADRYTPYTDQARVRKTTCPGWNRQTGPIR